MHGLNEKDMQAVVNTYNLKNLYYPSLFPIGPESPMLTWKMLEGQAGLRIAADLVARGATIPRKIREAVSRLQGDIPKIAISRDKHEDELTEYDILVSMASNNPDQRALVEFWAEDTKFCFDGVANRLEWIALRQISLGKVAITNANNAAIVNEYNVDYLIPAAQKVGVDTSWASGITGKPLTKDFPSALAIGKAIGASYKFAFMNSATLTKFVSQTQVINACQSALINLATLQQEPDLAMANSMLAKRVNLKGLQIVEIDQDVTVELANGARTTVNPFEDDVVMFSESKVLGRTFWKTPADMKLQASKAMKVMNGHTCIKKFSEEEPIKEVTMGIANAFPAWNLSGRSVLMQVNNTTWTK